jgi:hypothetical protein
MGIVISETFIVLLNKLSKSNSKIKEEYLGKYNVMLSFEQYNKINDNQIFALMESTG